MWWSRKKSDQKLKRFDRKIITPLSDEVLLARQTNSFHNCQHSHDFIKICIRSHRLSLLILPVGHVHACSINCPLVIVICRSTLPQCSPIAAMIPLNSRSHADNKKLNLVFSQKHQQQQLPPWSDSKWCPAMQTPYSKWWHFSWTQALVIISHITWVKQLTWHMKWVCPSCDNGQAVTSRQCSS